MKYLILILNLVFVGSIQTGPTKTFYVSADVETDPVLSKDDAADDPAIWIWGEKPNEGLLIGTNKKWGLEIYNLKGKRIAGYALGNINNADILSNENTYILLAATNRTEQCIDIYRLNRKGELSVLSHNQLPKEAEDIYGICAYRDGQSKYVIASDKAGRIFKWAVKEDTTLELNQKIKFNSTCEGLVADPAHNRLLVNEEDLGIWCMNLDDITQNQHLELSTDNNIRSDLEGISIYQTDRTNGYIVFSIQGSNSFGLLDRVTLNYLGKFKITREKGIDGVRETDGLDINSKSTQEYPKGILVVQDGDNYPYNQNFKIISFEKIIKGLEQ
ncbi:MAG: hypothetical protein RLZZ241_1954 [Bacteroidota bacterium]